MSRSHGKSTVSRRSEILKELNSKGQVSVVKLSKAFHVSEVTIRNDLVQLEKQNMLIRARGCAFKINLQHIGIDSTLSKKGKEHFHEKQRIGRSAIKFIEEGGTIIPDSGTTTIEIAKKVIGVADSSIFARRRFAFIAPISKIDVVITDSGIPDEDKQRLESAGVEVIIA